MMNKISIKIVVGVMILFFVLSNVAFASTPSEINSDKIKLQSELISKLMVEVKLYNEIINLQRKYIEETIKREENTEDIIYQSQQLKVILDQLSEFYDRIAEQKEES